MINEKRIIADKCCALYRDSAIVCPRAPVMARFHYGQFGHQVLFLYCDKHWEEYWRKPVTDEEKLLAEIFDHPVDRKEETTLSEEESQKLMKEWDAMIAPPENPLANPQEVR
jgi:hypothetical protein